LCAEGRHTGDEHDAHRITFTGFDFSLHEFVELLRNDEISEAAGCPEPGNLSASTLVELAAFLGWQGCRRLWEDEKIPDDPKGILAGEVLTGHEALAVRSEGVFSFSLPWGVVPIGIPLKLLVELRG
jgi:hypothetical protein